MKQCGIFSIFLRYFFVEYRKCVFIFHCNNALPLIHQKLYARPYETKLNQNQHQRREQKFKHFSCRCNHFISDTLPVGAFSLSLSLFLSLSVIDTLSLLFFLITSIHIDMCNPLVVFDYLIVMQSSYLAISIACINCIVVLMHRIHAKTKIQHQEYQHIYKFPHISWF